MKFSEKKYEEARYMQHSQAAEKMRRAAIPQSVEEGEERLLLLAKKLRTVPKNRFDYGRWVGTDWQGKEDLSCGTQACALGWAATMPEFKKLNLRLALVKKGFEPLRFVMLGNKEVIAERAPFEAAMVLFGLNFPQANSLFSPGDNEQDATAEDVADKIEQFVYERRLGRLETRMQKRLNERIDRRLRRRGR